MEVSTTSDLLQLELGKRFLEEGWKTSSYARDLHCKDLTQAAAMMASFERGCLSSTGFLSRVSSYEHMALYGFSE